VEERIDEIITARRTKGRARRMSRLMVDEDTQDETVQYVFATLDAKAIKDLARRDSRQSREDRAIHHIWPDFPLKTLINTSISTVKADAAHSSFAAGGAGIVWAARHRSRANNVRRWRGVRPRGCVRRADCFYPEADFMMPQPF
jgi:hypothetical protein